MRYFNFGDITPSQIQIFLKAAETENFSQTANALNITQPHVSHTISTLEYMLDFPLFSRIGKKVRLTSAGRVLYENWKNLFSSITNAIDLAHQAYLCQSVSLTIADKTGLNKDFYLYPLLDRFKAAYEGVGISVDQFSFQQGLEKVVSGKADVGFCLLSEINRMRLTDVSMRVLISRPMLAFVSPGSPIYDKASVTPEELSKIPFMLCDPSIDPHYNEDTLEIFRSRGLTPIIHSYASDGVSLMLRRGFSDAVTIFAPFIDEMGARGLSRIPISDTSASLVLYWNNISENVNIPRFVEIASGYFSSMKE